MSHWTGLILVNMVFLIGLVGILLPLLPGLPLIWLGILVYALLTHFSQVTPATVLITGVLTLLGVALDFLAGILGAKVGGSGKEAVLGALLGAVTGFFIFNLPGIIIGSFLGAAAGEYFHYQKISRSLKAGVNVIIGVIAGFILKISIAFLIITLFLKDIL